MLMLIELMILVYRIRKNIKSLESANEKLQDTRVCPFHLNIDGPISPLKSLSKDDAADYTNRQRHDDLIVATSHKIAPINPFASKKKS
jgi:hypothetical protein